jgi:hypothetical protein
VSEIGGDDQRVESDPFESAGAGPDVVVVDATLETVAAKAKAALVRSVG